MKYRLLHQGNDVRLTQGEYLIGRGPQCAIQLEDPTVSRQHALLRVQDEGAELEDLGSRNGSLVNGQAVVGRQQLKSGDCIKIACHDLVLLEGTSPRANDTTARDEPNPPEDILSLLCELADKALALGNPAEAERILGHYFESLTRQAGSGLRPSGQVLRTALNYAARLALETRRGRWLNYVFELSNLLGSDVSGDVMERLYDAAGRLESVETRALVQYLELHRERRGTMTPRQRFDLGRAEGLLNLLQR